MDRNNNYNKYCELVQQQKNNNGHTLIISIENLCSLNFVLGFIFKTNKQINLYLCGGGNKGCPFQNWNQDVRTIDFLWRI